MNTFSTEVSSFTLLISKPPCVVVIGTFFGRWYSICVFSSIINCCVCQVDGHMICLVETTKEVPHCPILASKITATLSDVHHVIISVVVLLRPSSIPMSTQGNSEISENKDENRFLGTPQRQRAAEMLLQDKFNPILMSYNC